MLRIGLISDTHGLLRPEALAFLLGCDRIVHGGDIGGAEILERLAGIAPLTAVRGNNDVGDGQHEMIETVDLHRDPFVAWKRGGPRARPWRRPGAPRRSAALVLLARARRRGRLLVERLPVGHAAAQELRPLGHGDRGRRRLGQQRPQLRLVPAQRVAAGLAVLPDRGAQPPQFGEQLLARERVQVFVHRGLRARGARERQA